MIEGIGTSTATVDHRPSAHRFAPTAIILAVTFAFTLAAYPFALAAPELPAPRERQPDVSEQTLTALVALAPSVQQSQKVWVYFTDKGIQSPEAYERGLADATLTLDRHAVARRAKVLGADLVDYDDLPVDPNALAKLEFLGATIVHPSRWLNAVSVRAPLAVLEEIARQRWVSHLTLVRGGGSILPRPSEVAHGPQLPAALGDPFDYGPSRDQLDEISVVAVHAAGYSGTGVRIAMLDTGYWRQHPGFDHIHTSGRLIAQWDFINNDGETGNEPGDPEGQDFHGTTTWSAVGAFAEGEMIGVAYGAEYLLAKTEDTTQEVPAEEDNWVAAAEWADQQGADIISSSLGYIAWYTYADMDGNTAPTTIAADIAASRGIVVCTSAGNWGTQDWFHIGAPADGDSVIAVGATEPDGSMWGDSSHGPTADGRIKPEVCARGSLTYAAQIPGGHGGPDLYRHFDGTSMSCPLVAGAAALILEAHPAWTPMQVREALMMTADNAQAPDNHRGWGRIDVMAAIGGTSGVVASAPILTTPELHATPNPFRARVDFTFDLPAGFSGPALLEVYSPLGRQVRAWRASPATGVVTWDGRTASGELAPSGVYFVRLRAGETQVIRKTILSR